ncbi:hypothetical protein ACHAQA_000568 [Verticillium albo-atrum]
MRKDETHGAALKRRLTETSTSMAIQKDFNHILRTRGDKDIAAVIQRLRAGDEIRDIVRLVNDGDLPIQCSLDPKAQFRYVFPFVTTMPSHLYVPSNPYVGSLLHLRTIEDASAPRRASNNQSDPWKIYDVPFHAASVVEPRLDKVTASRWTTVTTSDTLVQTLLRTYLQCEFPYNCFFDLDPFLDDLAAGREKYCSPLLVNAILASACHCQSSVPNRSAFWDPRTLGYRFLAEAKRLWELEKNCPTAITTVQAGAVICVICNLHGIDKVGSAYLIQAIALATDLGLFTEDFASKSRKQRNAYAVTAWSLFSWQAVQRYVFFLGPLLPEPPVVSLPTRAGDIQVLFQQDSAPRSIHHSMVVRAVFEFRLIMNHIGIRLFGTGKTKGPLALSEALAYRRKLASWMADLPSPLSARLIVFPAELKLHIHYYKLMLGLFEPLAGAAHSGDGDPGVEDATTNEPSAKEIVAWCKACMESLLRLYYSRHSFESCDPTMTAYLQYLAFNALQDLSRADPGTSKATLSTVVLCAKGLRDQSRCYYIAEAIFMVLRDSLEPDAARLLRDFAYIEDEEERKEIVARQVKSVYPVNIISVADDPEMKRLDSLVKAYSGHELDESTDSESKDSSTP